MAIDDLPEHRQEIDRLAATIAGDNASAERLKWARTIAGATADLRRIREIRHQALKEMAQDTGAWVALTVPQVHIHLGRDGWVAPLAVAIGLAELSASGSPNPRLSRWVRTFDRLDRYERRALSRRKTAARAWYALTDNDDRPPEGRAASGSPGSSDASSS